MSSSLLAMLRPGGSIVSIVEAPNAERADVNCLLFVVEPNGEQLTELARRIDTERLRPVVGNVVLCPTGPPLGEKGRGWHTWQGRAHPIEPCRGVK